MLSATHEFKQKKLLMSSLSSKCTELEVVLCCMVRPVGSRTSQSRLFCGWGPKLRLMCTADKPGHVFFGFSYQTGTLEGRACKLRSLLTNRQIVRHILWSAAWEDISHETCNMFEKSASAAHRHRAQQVGTIWVFFTKLVKQ